MRKIFTLALCAAGLSSMSLMAADINVNPSANLKTVVAEAAAGDVLILADGEYTNYGEDDATEIMVEFDKDITIKAENTGKAILRMHQFRTARYTEIENITIEGIVAIHDATLDSKYFFQINNDGDSELTNLTVRDCYVEGYGRGGIRATKELTVLENLVVDNCVFVNLSPMNPGYAQINPQKCDSKTIKITNSTFYGSKAALFRYEGTTAVDVLIENCTILDCGSAGGKKMVEVGGSVSAESNFLIKDCIFSGSYDETPPAEKPIDLQNLGSIENCILEGYSINEEKPEIALYNRVNTVSLVEGTVTDFIFDTFTINTDPSTIEGIGDPRWTLNGNTPDNISDTVVEKEVVSTEYYDLMGRKVSADWKGLILVKSTYVDGTADTKKVIR